MDFQADALYYQARENGVSYAIYDEKVMNPDFQSHFGVRGRLGIDVCHDCWQVNIQFLHYHARNRTIDEIFNLWRLHLGLGDIFLGRYFEVSPCLEFTPFFGLSYGMIRHKLAIESNASDWSMKNKFWGLGPMMGLEGLWGLFGGLSIYSRGVFRLLVGHVYVHQDEAKRLKFYNAYDQIQSVLEGALGLDFRKGMFFARIGFDLYLFPSINQLASFSDDIMLGKFYANQGDLSLHGASLGIGIVF